MSMKEGTCPQCGSTDVRSPALTRGGYRLIAPKVTPTNDRTLDEYICCDCGYFEMYGNQALREYARENWASVIQRG